jgi:4-amino-4-deoxy-L-arabinose transferase-like glycosyltransferase
MSRQRILLTVALALFLGLATYQLTLPGLHYDEAFEAVPAMQLLLHQPVTTFRSNGILVGGHLFPLMTQDYIGAINTYAAIPFFLLLGINPLSLRVMAIAVGLATLWLTYRLANALYGPMVAALAGLLLAVNPTFVFWSRQGVFVTSVTATIGLGATLSWLRWWRTGARRYAIAGAFLLGLGLYAKLLFLWLIIALGLAVLLLNLPKWRQVVERLTRGLVGWAGLAFLLGSTPLLVYNLQTGGTLSSIGGNLTTSYYGIDNLAFLPNLLERLKQFAAVLAGSHFWYLGGTYANWLGIGLFLVALGIVLSPKASSPGSTAGADWGGPGGTYGRLALTPGRDDVRRALFPFIVIGGVILSSCVTVSALWVTHFAILTPWPPLAIAASIGLFVRYSGLRRASSRVDVALILALVVVGVSLFGDVFTDFRYHQALGRSGGLGAHSDAVEDLARWLSADGRRRTPVVAMDWGIAAPVTFLTRGEVTPLEAFGYKWETDADFKARLIRFIDDRDSIYLWRAPDEIIFDRSADFRALYTPLGLEEDILEAFYERSGRPVLGVTQLVPKGTALNPPQPR